jgi:hypothetical protein
MGQLQPSNKTIVGIAVLLFGAILLGVGLHHMVATGTCSSTGYSANYGPVPHCPKGTGWWFLFLFAGIFMVVIGALVSGGSSMVLLIPAIFSAIGVGALTVAFDKHVAHGTKIFGYVFGGAFATFGVLPALFFAVAGVRKLFQRPATGTTSTSFSGGSGEAPDAILGAYHAASTPVISTPAISAPPLSLAGSAPKPGHGDVLDKISKLSDLHKSGALTDDEFNREKAKLLAEL